MPTCPVKVLHYLDYRQYLRDVMDWRKKHNPRLSQRAFAKSLGLPPSSYSFLSAVIRSRANLSSRLRIRCGQLLQLSEKENQYFELLVQFNQAKEMEAKNHFYEQLSKYRGSLAHQLKQSQLRFYSKWYYSVVWNYIGLKGKNFSLKRLGEEIHPPISREQAQEALELLQELGLITKIARGYKIVNTHLATPENIRSTAVRNYTNELLQLGLQAFKEVPASHRLYNTMMVHMSRETYQTVCQRIRGFQEELRHIIDRDQDEDRIYSLVVQLFPNTRTW